jgi:hypothetical protein
MSRTSTKRGLWIALLTVVAAAVFLAPQARAEEAGWLVGKSKLTAPLSPQLKMSLDGDETLLGKVSGVKIEKLCTEAELIEAKIETEGKISSGAKIKLSGCQIKLNGTLSKACEPHTGAMKGVVITNGLKGQLVLHEGAGLVQLTPVSGETLMTVEMGEECAVGEKIKVGGVLTLKDTALTTEATEHLFVEGPLTNVWFISNTPEHKVVIDGGVIISLAGEHAGLQWSGLPG